jgi:hypothetical protein
MLRAKLVLVLMALLAPAAVVPTVAQTSPSGLGIVRALEETLPGNLGNFNERLENLFGLSSHSDAGIDAVAIGNANNTDAINGFASNMPAATQEFDTEGIRSGNGLPSVDISNSGNYVNLCSNVQQSANTGNVVNQQGSAQNPSVSEEIGLRGSSITISPTASATCTQSITQGLSSSER